MDYTVHGVAKSWTQLSNFHFHFHSLEANRKPLTGGSRGGTWDDMLDPVGGGPHGGRWV